MATTIKKTGKKAVMKSVKKPVIETGLTVHVLDTNGKQSGTLTLPKELFDTDINKTLIAQSVRVYLANQRAGGAATKTRGMVEGSTRKIYRQKGTGKARHGSIRAPIFIGGGVVFGPVPHNFSLTMPKKMKIKALTSALTQKRKEGNIIVVDGLDVLESKTKVFATAMQAVGAGKKSLLIVPQKYQKVTYAARNLEDIDVLRAVDLHPYAVMVHKKLIFTKSAVSEAKERFI